jgi:hypothetical protein
MLCIIIVPLEVVLEQVASATSTVLKGSSALSSGKPAGSVLLHARVRATLMAAGLDLPHAGGYALQILQG